MASICPPSFAQVPRLLHPHLRYQKNRASHPPKPKHPLVNPASSRKPPFQELNRSFAVRPKRIHPIPTPTPPTPNTNVSRPTNTPRFTALSRGPRFCPLLSYPICHPAMRGWARCCGATHSCTVWLGSILSGRGWGTVIEGMERFRSPSRWRQHGYECSCDPRWTILQS